MRTILSIIALLCLAGCGIFAPEENEKATVHITASSQYAWTNNNGNSCDPKSEKYVYFMVYDLSRDSVIVNHFNFPGYNFETDNWDCLPKTDSLDFDKGTRVSIEIYYMDWCTRSNPEGKAHKITIADTVINSDIYWIINDSACIQFQ